MRRKATQAQISQTKKTLSWNSTGGLLDFDTLASVKKAKPPKVPKRKFLERLSKTRNVITDKSSWSTLTASDFVYLYAVLHESVYGFTPVEVRDQMKSATFAAARVLNQQFDGSRPAMVEFMRWCWTREKRSFATRPPENDFRIGWRYQFCERVLTDYRIYLSKKGRLK